MKLVCENCGSINIETTAWVNANTQEYKSEGINELEDRWCEECQEHVNFISDDEWLEEQERN